MGYTVTRITSDATGNAGDNDTWRSGIYNVRPEFTADSAKVVFESYASNLGGGQDTNGLRDAFIANVDGSGVTRLSSAGGNAGNSLSLPRAISPDGSKVLLLSYATDLVDDPSDTPLTFDFFVVGSDGTGTVGLPFGSLLSTFNGVFSPDGARLYFERDQGGAFVTDADGLYGIDTFPGVPVAFSPDGTKVLFNSRDSTLGSGTDSNNTDDVFVANSDGSDAIRLSSVGGNAANAISAASAFSPDGTKVLFVSYASDLGGGTDSNNSGDLFVANADGTGLVRLSSVGGAAANHGSQAIGFSADGTKVLFTSDATDLGGGLDTNGSRDVFVVNTDGSGLRRVASVGGDAANGGSFAAMFSPDGSKILFGSNANDLGGGTDDNDATDVFVANTDGSGVTRISSVGANAANGESIVVGFALGGNKVVFSSSAIDLPGGSISPGSGAFYIANPDGSDLERITAFGPLTNSGGQAVAISPDGTKLLFVSKATDLAPFDGPAQDLFIADLAGGPAAGGPTLGFHFSNGTPDQGGTIGGPELPADAMLVVATETTYGTLVENRGIWNATKNAFATSNAWSDALGSRITVANFVDARVDFANAGDTDLAVTLLGAKRGQVVTADGDDTVTVVFHSNSADWSNQLLVATGGGADTVLATAVGLASIDNGVIADNAQPRNGPFWNRFYDGAYSTLQAALGDGADRAEASGQVQLVAEGGSGSDTLIGGARADKLDGGAGLDICTGNAGDDLFIMQAGETEGDVITDFEGAGVTGGDMLRLVGFGPGATLRETAPGNYAVESGGATVGSFSAAAGLVVGLDVLFVA